MVRIEKWKAILVILVCAMGFLYAAPNVVGASAQNWMSENLPGWAPSKTINLGLDLRGGAHLLYDVDVDVVFDERAELMVSDARKELREAKIGYRRIGKLPQGLRVTLREADDLSVARKIIAATDPNLLVSVKDDGLTIEATLNEMAVADLLTQTINQSIEIVRRRVDELGTTEPSIARQGERRILLQVPGANAEDLKRIIGKTAKLSFHLVSGEAGGVSTRSLPLADNPTQDVPIQRRAMITGEMLSGAQPAFDQGGQAVVSFRLNSAGAKRFCDVSRSNVGKPFAIVLDNEVISAPVIREAICGGQGQISGGFTVQTANELALLLRAGALPAPLTVMEERTVGPSLGADSVQAGKIASIIALSLVLVFMFISYGTFGAYADVALVVNVALLFAILSGLQATLTLPGIAGIVLTVGMAVDANVLIFERIREERAAGRSILSAIDAGYSRAMTTIIDSNLTTLIAAIILFSFGTGPIKGFAVTLGVGILTSFFSAIMVTRLLVIWWLRRADRQKLPI